MLPSKTRAQWTLLKWIVNLHKERQFFASYICFDLSPKKRIKNTLTVTLLSKKYLSVSMRPRTISVRNNVFMLRSKTAIEQNTRNQSLSKKKVM